jgi:hypothetical protein
MPKAWRWAKSDGHGCLVPGARAVMVISQMCGSRGYGDAGRGVRPDATKLRCGGGLAKSPSHSGDASMRSRSANRPGRAHLAQRRDGAPGHRGHLPRRGPGRRPRLRPRPAPTASPWTARAPAAQVCCHPASHLLAAMTGARGWWAVGGGEGVTGCVRHLDAECVVPGVEGEAEVPVGEAAVRGGVRGEFGDHVCGRLGDAVWQAPGAQPLGGEKSGEAGAAWCGDRSTLK